MSSTFTPDEALAALADVRASMAGHFGAHHETRLGQLGGALDTAVMAVEHLVDEEAREVDLANRIIAREKVHGEHEVADPLGRPYSDTLRIAGKG